MQKANANTLVIWEEFKENTEKFDSAKMKIEPEKVYKIYTDGACKTNPGRAGIGYKGKYEIRAFFLTKFILI